MIRCLNGEELIQVLAFHESGIQPRSSVVRSWVEGSLAWEDQLVGLNYILTQILLSAKKRDADCQGMISLFYSLGDSSWFTIAECDLASIEDMLRTCRDPDLSLAEELLQLEYKRRSYDYENTLRL